MKSTQPSPTATFTALKDGRLTEESCAVLNIEDFIEVGWDGRPASAANAEILTDGVACRINPGPNVYLLSLYSDPAEARKLFASDRAYHDREMQAEQRPTHPREDVLPGADESWIDNHQSGTPGSSTILAARKGRLMIDIDVSAGGEEAERVLLDLGGRLLTRMTQAIEESSR